MRYGRSLIAEQIVHYLRMHPKAGDTLEGIARWWLASEQIDASVRDTAAALETLVQTDIVEAVRTSTGATFFRLKRHEQKDP
jgi:hypothetical protein